ncbi:Hypothetical predicted protein [Lecanosticta acicola]|uniref:Polysaccharide export protein n=1 Tax=Lecanosticta acicola TaxID=111012 RepID=A0AAI9E8C3_9PEZI|nr:Hypothetical predicted protein [Lecanosticta acicola]
MLIRNHRRNPSWYQCARIIALVLATWSAIELLYIRNAIVREAAREPPHLGREKIFITSIHWNNEAILRSHWNDAVVTLVKEIGKENVYVSLQESGSFDDSKGALRDLDARLDELGVSRTILLDETTHLDEIQKAPAPAGWIRTPRGETELRRIPYLAKLRNLVMEPLYELEKQGVVFDKVLFLNDVVFSSRDVRNLLATQGGEYAAACSLDFSKPFQFYDTFALRDAEGHDQLMLTWPFFRSKRSRQALKASLPVPVKSCWNGIVAMDASPFYRKERRLEFRGVADPLAVQHIEGSECCLIHGDNPVSRTKGVWLNPNVRVGYGEEAYKAMNRKYTSSWLSSFQIIYGTWENRILRWTTAPWLKERSVHQKLKEWEERSPENSEPGPFCLVNEMQVLTWNGWAHL